MKQSLASGLSQHQDNPAGCCISALPAHGRDEYASSQHVVSPSGLSPYLPLNGRQVHRPGKGKRQHFLVATHVGDRRAVIVAVLDAALPSQIRCRRIRSGVGAGIHARRSGSPTPPTGKHGLPLYTNRKTPSLPDFRPDFDPPSNPWRSGYFPPSRSNRSTPGRWPG